MSLSDFLFWLCFVPGTIGIAYVYYTFRPYPDKSEQKEEDYWLEINDSTPLS